MDHGRAGYRTRMLMLFIVEYVTNTRKRSPGYGEPVCKKMELKKLAPFTGRGMIGNHGLYDR